MVKTDDKNLLSLQDPLGSCKKCVCNNNVNPSAAGNCNTTTGECLRCLFETVGDSCQFCRPGFFGDALEQKCNGMLLLQY